MTPSIAPSGETLPEVSVMSRLGGGAFDGDVVTSRLGIEPTPPRRGDPVAAQFDRRRGGWVVRVGPRETLDVAGMLGELRARLSVPSELVRRTCAELGLTPTIECAFEPRPTLTPIITFCEEVVAWVGDLGASIRVDVLRPAAGEPAPFNHEELPEVSVTFGLRGARFDPDVVTARLGIEPTISYRVGDPIPGRSVPRREDGWIVNVGPRETLDLPAMLLALREQLPIVADVLRQTCLELGVSPSIYCPVSPTPTLVPDITLPEDMVTWASALGASIGVDVMLWADDDDGD